MNLPTYLQNYINIAQQYGQSPAECLKNNFEANSAFLASITENQANYAYQPNKWTIKEIIRHCIDCEWVFVYRAMCLARNEKQNLLSFNQNEYNQNSNANNLTWQQLTTELALLRRSSIAFFENLNTAQLNQQGTVNNVTLSPYIIGMLTAGHLQHHCTIIKERYL